MTQGIALAILAALDTLFAVNLLFAFAQLVFQCRNKSRPIPAIEAIEALAAKADDARLRTLGLSNHQMIALRAKPWPRQIEEVGRMLVDEVTRVCSQRGQKKTSQSRSSTRSLFSRTLKVVSGALSRTSEVGGQGQVHYPP